MSRFTVEGKVELDLEKAQKGVIELDSSIEKVGKTTKKVSDDSGRFMRGFSSSMKSASISGEQAGKRIGNAFSNALGPVGLIVTGIMSLVKIIKDAVGQSEDAQKALGSLGDLLKTVFKPVLDLVIKSVTALANGFTKLVSILPTVKSRMREVKEEQDALAVSTMRAAEVLEMLSAENDKLNRDLRLGLIDRKRYTEEQIRLTETGLRNILNSVDKFEAERKQAEEKLKIKGFAISAGEREQFERDIKWLDNEIKNATQAYWVLMKTREDLLGNVAALSGEDDLAKQQEAARTIISGYLRRRDVVKELTDVIGDEQKKEAESLSMSLENISRLRGELKNFLEDTGYTREEMADLYKWYDWAGDQIEKLTEQLKGQAGEEENILTLEMMRADIAKAGEKFEASRASAINKFNLGLMSATELETTLNLLAIQHNEEINALYGNYRDVEGAVDLVYESMLEVKNVLDDTNDALHETLANINGFLSQASSSILDITRRVAEDQIDIIYRHLEDQQKALDAAFNESKRRMEEERQRALELAGLVKAETEKGLEEALEAAIASGDERTIYEEKRRQKELAINKEYDAKELQAKEAYDAEVERAETEANKRIAQLQYKQAMFEWTASLAQAGVNIAEAITRAMAQTGIMAPASVPIIASLGALQVGAIMANVPQVPKFKHGGVMGLPETYFSKFAGGGIARGNTQRGVDALPALIAKGEMILNDGQQSNLFDMINRGGGGLHIEVPLVVDGIEMARVVINSVNAGRTQKIQARMVG